MDKLEEIIKKLEKCMYMDIEKGVEQVNTNEFGKVADIVKDLTEAMYYWEIVEAMEKSEYGVDYDWEGRKYFKKHIPNDYRMSVDDYKNYDAETMRDIDKKMGRMYFTEPMHDSKMGKSYLMRKNYMETAEMHKTNSIEDKQIKMRELENYMRELADDITEMIKDATPEERNMLKTKMQMVETRL